MSLKKKSVYWQISKAILLSALNFVVMDDIHSTYCIILVIRVVNSRVSSIFSTLPSLGASHADRDFTGHLGVDDTYIREGYCSPSVYPTTLMLQFGSISGHQPPTNSMGRDIELLKLNPALDFGASCHPLESVAIRWGDCEPPLSTKFYYYKEATGEA